MSAVCGVITTGGPAARSADLGGVVADLAPLGPDGHGTWEGQVGRCGVAVAALLQRRTPEDAADRQPWASSDGSIVVVADVRLDNRRALAAALPIADRPDAPDSAFLVAAYERWGTRFLERLVGVFAVAVVDRRRGGVLLARDHVGARPLVVHERSGLFAFASNALALTAFPGVGHELDVERATDVLALVPTSDRTFVRGVRPVAPGTCTWIDADGARTSRWWDPDPDEIVDLGSPSAHAEALRATFDEVVRAQLRSTGSVATQTSGGLDSASVTATAALAVAPDELRSYTSVPATGVPSSGDRITDESSQVQDLAALHPNLRPVFVDVAGEAIFEGRYEQRWEAGAGPIVNPCNALWIDAIRQRARGDGATTLLTGASGNSFFSANGPHELPALVRAHRFSAASASARGLLSRQGARRFLRDDVARFLLPGWAHEQLAAVGLRPRRTARWSEFVGLRPEVLAELDLERLLPQLDVRHRPHERVTALRSLRNQAVGAEERAAVEALHGIDERDPTSDRRVIELAMTQPEWVRRHDGIGRAVAREAMADRLPASIHASTRRGLQLSDWLDRLTDRRTELRDEVAAARAHDLSRELLDIPRLERLVDDWPDRGRAADPTTITDYRYALLRSLVVSRYLRWFEARAGRTT